MPAGSPELRRISKSGQEDDQDLLVNKLKKGSGIQIPFRILLLSIEFVFKIFKRVEYIRYNVIPHQKEKHDKFSSINFHKQSK